MDSIPQGTKYLRNWKIDVYRSEVVGAKPGPNALLGPSTTAIGASGEISLTIKPASSTPVSLTSGLDLSAFRTTFEITAADTETPNIAIIRVYNVGEDTANKLCSGQINQSEFGRVVLQAGYGKDLGVIFDGKIKQAFRGRENETDTFVILHAADGDDFYNFSTLSCSLDSQASDPQSIFNCIKKNATNAAHVFFPDSLPSVPAVSAGTLGGIVKPRGKVLFGMTRVFMRQLADSVNMTWSIQNGQIVFRPKDDVDKSLEPFEITAQTGQIGLPTQTNQGIRIRCLIDPRMQVGSLIRLNNKSIQQALANLTRAFLTDPMKDPQNLFAHLSTDGLYRIFAIDYKGDSRGNPWYADFTCLSVDPTTNKVNG